MNVDEASWYFGPGRDQSSGVYEIVPLVVGSDGTVSMVKIVCVSLSPRVEKPKSQEGNKSFVPEQRKSSVFRGFRGIPMYLNILRIVIMAMLQ